MVCSRWPDSRPRALRSPFAASPAADKSHSLCLSDNYCTSADIRDIKSAIQRTALGPESHDHAQQPRESTLSQQRHVSCMCSSYLRYPTKFKNFLRKSNSRDARVQGRLRSDRRPRGGTDDFFESACAHCNRHRLAPTSRFTYPTHSPQTMAAAPSMAAAVAASLPAPQSAPTPAAPTYEAIPASMARLIDLEADIPVTGVQLDGMVN